MSEACSSHFVTRQVEEWRDRKALPIFGWSFLKLALLDRSGARGLVADLAHAGALTRQAAYVAVACTDLDAPAGFLRRLGVDRDDAEGVGIALRQRRAREVIAATFGVHPSEVPTGYLRSLARIEEANSQAAGFDAFARPTSYRTLFDLFRGDRRGRRTQALRYAAKMRSDTIDAAMNLDPILVWPEVLDATGTPKRVAAANSVLGLIKLCVSTAEDADLADAMRQSLRQSGGVLKTFALKALERADRLPTPIPAADGIRPLRTAADYAELGARMKNCAATKLAEVALGLLAVVEATHRGADGTESTVAVSLTPTVDGRWMVSEINGARNRRPPSAVMRDVLLRLQALGAIIPGPMLDGRYRSELADSIGVYRWRSIDDALHGVEDEDDVLAGFEAALDAA